ncbi:MAG: rRNA processing protein RimM [Bacteroidota bacterium]
MKPSGFSGELIVAAETVEPEVLEESSHVFLLIDGLPVPFRIAGFRMKSGNVILKLKDVDSEDAAKTLNGIEVYLEQLPEYTADADPSFSDLEGYQVIDGSAGIIGPILEVEELPMQYVARCDYQGKEVLIPLNEAIVTAIDPDNRTVHMSLPAGLLEVYLGNEEDGEDDEVT